MTQNIFLAHHGIRGQKWGVRNGPPYPLGSNQKSSSELHNPTNEMLNKLSGCDPVTIAYVSTLAVAYIASIAVSVKQLKKQQEDYLKKFRENSMEKLEKMKNERSVKSLSDLPRISDKMEAKENAKVTNPNFPQDGYVVNCTFCTTAMAMREKGYDVEAMPSDQPWYTDDLYEKVWGVKSTQMNPKQTRTEMLKTLAQHGDGSYGELGVQWKVGGGHSIFWKNESGRVHIYDGQSGEEYDTSKSSKLMKYIDLSNVDYCRLDDREPTEYALAITRPRSKGDNDDG